MKTTKIIYSSKDAEVNNQIYQAFLNINLEDGWNADDKVDNFVQFTHIVQFTKISFRDKTILDVGCGTGDLGHFLEHFGVKKYVGIDIFENSIIRANHKYPKYLFILDDFLKHKFDQKFDYVACSGALTTNLNTDNYKILGQWVKKMWQLCEIGVYFNILLQEYPGQKGGSLFLYDQKKIMEILETELPGANIKTITTNTGSGDYLYELHVYLYKQ